MGEVIAFVSGKGGTGKTSASAGIGLSLAAKGFSVLCVDCDAGLRNLDLYLAMDDCGALSFQDICQGGYPLSKAMEHPQVPRLRFLTAPASGTMDAVDADAFAQMLSAARQEFDYIFLDAPTGIGTGFRLVAECADRCIVMTESDPAAIRDAGAVAQVLELMGMTQVRMVVNRIRKGMLRQMKMTVDDLMDRAGLPLLGIVPEDVSIPLAVAAGKTLIDYDKHTDGLLAYQRIGQRICGKTVAIPSGKFK